MSRGNGRCSSRLSRPAILLLSMTAIASGSASGFDTRTHAAMSTEAIAASALGRDTNASVVMRRLGLIDYSEPMSSRFPSLGKMYIDLGTENTPRYALAFEGAIMDEVRRAYLASLGVPHELSLSGWLIRGAIREDDNRLETPKEKGGDEPGGVFNRVFGHFFDPVVNRGLTVAGVQVGARANDWALQPGSTVTSLPTSFGSRENHFKTVDAREAMWRALTLKTTGMGDEVYPQGWSGRSPVYWNRSLELV